MNIGEEQEEIIVEPIPETVPMPEPTPTAPTPVEPEKVPA